MYSFIPSWYGDNKSWVRDTEVWHRLNRQMEFDDAVNEIKIFRMAGEEVGITLLACVPDLRHFLHREGIDDVSVWSAFDEIQNIKGTAPRQICLNEYPWAEDVEWSSSPFMMIGSRDGKLYAKAEFAEDGWWMEATLFENEAPVRRMHLDDRGFISYSEFYKDGKPSYRLFYDRNGVWQIREDLIHHHVRVNKELYGRFARTAYEDMETLLEEVLKRHFEKCREDRLIIALDDRHNELIRRTAGRIERAYSVFSARNENLSPEMLLENLRENRLLVTDTQYLADRIRTMYPEFAGNVMDISPYDARLAFGKSTTIKELKILFYLDSVENTVHAEALKGIFTYMGENKNVELTVGLGRNTGRAVSDDFIKAVLNKFMGETGTSFSFVENEKNVAENEAEEEEKPRIAIRRCQTETQIIEILADHRIIADLSGTPDLYMEIAGISAGLPIILRTESQYVSHKNNGWILESEAEMEEALHFFLDGLANWNNSLVWCLRRIGEYTNGHIAGKWKQAMDERADRSSIEHGSNSDR